VSPLSRLTIAALADMGYEVDLDAADPYRLPSALELAALGIGGTRRRICCSQVVPRYVELPSSAVVRPRAAARPKSKPASRRKRPSRRG
jgi:hypothetical protein